MPLLRFHIEHLFKFIKVASVLFITSLSAQNFVPNGSFENLNDCPENENELSESGPWFSPSGGTPDLFNICAAGTDVGVPANMYGFQDPKTGDGYAGIFVFGDDDFREYLSIPLSTSLEAGTSYCIEYWVSYADLFNDGIQDFGFYFSNNAPSSMSEGPLNAVPQFVYANGIIDENADWTLVSSQFIAEDDYSFLTIGNFFDNENTTGGNIVIGTPFVSEAFYYIDDVSVVPTGESLSFTTGDLSCDDNVVNISATGGSGNYVWFDSNNTDQAIAFGEELTITVTETTVILLTSAAGSCEQVETITLEPVTGPVVNLQVNATCADFDTEILTTVSNTAPGDTFTWSITDLSNGETVFTSPNVGGIVTQLPIGQYLVNVIVENMEGCSDEVSAIFDVGEDCPDCVFSNLVPNSSFEELTDCPDEIDAIDSVLEWVSATSATPDYFNICATEESGTSVPDNEFGSQEAQEGNGYIGIFAFGEQNYREYASIPLIEVLEEGKTFCVSYDVSLAEGSSLAVNNLGAFLSPGSVDITGTGFTTNLPFSPQFENAEIISDTNGWTTVTGTFTAETALAFLTIGNFQSNANTTGEVLSTGSALFSYYYVDNVAVYEVPLLDVTVQENSCIGDNVEAVATSGFCEYNWFALSAPNTVLGTDNTFEIPTNGANQETYVLSALFGDCVQTDTLQFEVFGVPNASFSSPGGCAGIPTQLLVQNPDGESYSYDWDIDSDGVFDISSEGSTSFTYTEPGTYTVSVLVQNEAGCSNGSQQTITIEEDCSDCFANSLILNGNFETVPNCPESLGEISNASGWLGDGDLYSDCNSSGSQVGVPTNSMGTQVPSDELSSYGGVVLFGPNEERSSLTASLISALEVGQEYCVSYEISLSEFSAIAVDEIALLFSDTEPNNTADNTLSVSSGNDEILIDTQNWTSISGVFTAQHPYEYVTIANFESNDDTNTFLNISGTMPNYSYYFVDNIRLISTDISLEEEVFVCQGDSITLSPFSGFCEHIWFNENDPSEILGTGSSLTVSPAASTTYTYVGINGTCEKEVEVLVTVIDSPDAGGNQNLCPGEELTVELLGVDSASNIEWSPNSGIDFSDPANPIFSPAETTTYFVSVEYDVDTQCSTTDSLTIEVVEAFVEVGDDVQICTEDATQLFASGGTSYLWTPSNGLDDPSSPTPFARPENSTEYSVEVFDDVTGCTSNATVLVEVFECDEGGPVWLDENGDPSDAVLFDTTTVNMVDTTYLPSFFDVDLPEDMVTLSFDGPFHGTFEFLVDSAFYTPDVNYFGMDSISMVACDSFFPIECDTTLILYTILPPLDAPPMFEGAGPLTFETQPDSLVLICPEIFDPNGDDFIITIDTPASPGTVEIVNDTCFSYRPSTQFLGMDSFFLTACDDNEDCNTIEYIITIDDDNGIALDDFVNVLRNDPVNVVVLNNDQIPSSGWEELFQLTDPLHGTVTPTDTSFFYLPDFNYLGPDTFMYALCGVNWCDTATVHLTVISDLEGVDDLFFGKPDEGHVIEVLNNDFIPFGDCVTIDIVEPPVNGIISEVILTIFYEPEPSFVGIDSFVYEICCPGFGCDQAAVIVNITNDIPPTAEDDMISIPEDTEITIDVLSNDSDAEGAELFVELLEGPSNGTVVLDGNEFVYTPDLGFVGIDTIQYQACNTNLLCSDAFVIIGVGEVTLPEPEPEPEPEPNPEPCELWFPEAFSPNGDGVNEDFFISGLEDCEEYAVNEFTVFNRWGNIVFEAENYGSGEWWDGNFKRNDEPVPAGTYFYLLRKPSSDRKDNFNGTVEVFR